MASRQEEKERLREERKAQEAEAAAKKAKQATARKFAMFGGGILVVIAIVVGVVVAGSGGDSKTADSSADVSELDFQTGPAPTAAIAIKDGSQKQLLAAAKTAGCTFNSNPNEGHEHEDPSTDFKYKQNPPTSGNHTPTWAEDGAYATETYSTPFLVHGLEHGRIEYLWDPEKVTKQELGSLKKLYDDDPFHLILHPSTTEMPYAIAATSWDHSLTCPKMNNDVFAALRLFKLNWIDQGREQIP